jgi:hypothetical protein
MEVTLELKGVEEMIKANQNFAKRLPTAVLNGIRNQVRQNITTVKRDIRTKSGLGNRIWGKKGKGLDSIVTLVKSRAAGGAVETGIKLKGMAAMIESGGQIKPHKIVGKPFLVFPGKSGGVTFAKVVNHPGAPVRAHNFARQALDRDGQKITTSVDKSVGKLRDQVFGAA